MSYENCIVQSGVKGFFCLLLDNNKSFPCTPNFIGNLLNKIYRFSVIALSQPPDQPLYKIPSVYERF